MMNMSVEKGDNELKKIRKNTVFLNPLPKINPNNKGNTLSVALDNLAHTMTDHPLYEHTEISWEGNLDELVLFMLIEACQSAANEDEVIAMLDPNVTKIGLSFRPHAQFKSILQVLYLSNIS